MLMQLGEEAQCWCGSTEGGRGSSWRCGSWWRRNGVVVFSQRCSSLLKVETIEALLVLQKINKRLKIWLLNQTHWWWFLHYLSYFERLINDIVWLDKEFHGVSFVWTHQTGNALAHKLANFGCLFFFSY